MEEFLRFSIYIFICSLIFLIIFQHVYNSQKTFLVFCLKNILTQSKKRRFFWLSILKKLQSNCQDVLVFRSLNVKDWMD